MLIHDLDTPAVVIDLDKLTRNIHAMHARCREVGIPLRSHTKSNKLPEIAHMQLRAGSIWHLQPESGRSRGDGGGRRPRYSDSL